MKGERRGFVWVASCVLIVAGCDRGPTVSAQKGEASVDVPVAAVASDMPCPVAGGCTGGPPAMRGAVSGSSTSWDIGNVFAGVSNGAYNVYDSSGTYKESISDMLGGFTTGCSFNPEREKLYTTNFSGSRVVIREDAVPHAILNVLNTGNDGGGAAESVVFDSLGNFYVGHASGSRRIHKYDSTGTLLATYPVAVENVGSDWIELAADQETMYYTSEGGRIMRYNVRTSAQLADLTNVGGRSYALRLLPPGDGSKGLLVAHLSDILLLDATGAVVRVYDAPGEDSWFALNLDPNGTSFWSGDINTGNFYRFNIATGAIEGGPTNAAGPSALFGLCLKGEATGAVPPPPPPPSGFEIDIEPEDSANVVRLTGRQMVVGVKSTSSFDATTIDPAKCRLFGDGAEPQRATLSLTRTLDVDRDGDKDLVLYFNIRSMVTSGNLSTATTSMRLKCGTLTDSDLVAAI